MYSIVQSREAGSIGTYSYASDIVEAEHRVVDGLPPFNHRGLWPFLVQLHNYTLQAACVGQITK